VDVQGVQIRHYVAPSNLYRLGQLGAITGVAAKKRQLRGNYFNTWRVPLLRPMIYITRKFQRYAMLRSLILMCLTAVPAAAQTTSICQNHFAASMHAVAEPLEANTVTYANGAIRVVRMDVGAPACCPEYLVVLHPAGSGPDEQFRKCTLVSMETDLGFSRIEFASHSSSYDPARGLTLSFIVEIPHGDTVSAGGLDVTINQATGEVTLN